MNVNDQMNTDKQNPDIAGETHINKSDLDDRAGDQVIMSEYASDEIEDAVPLVHLIDDGEEYTAYRGSDSGSSTV